MKVLLLTHISPPAIDGGSRIICKIGEYFQKNGHQVQLISSNCYSTDDFSHFVSKHTPSGIPVITFLHRPLKFLSRFFPVFKVFAIGPIFIYFPIPKFRPDIIIAGPFPTTISLYARIISLFTGAKLILIPCFHENDPAFHNPLLMNTLQKALVCTLSDHEKNVLHTPQIFTLQAGIDHDFIINKRNIPTQQNILFLGNFAAHKRVELLIEAFNILKEKYPRLTLTLAGQKTLYWPQIAKHLNSKIKVFFGYNQNELSALLSSATIMVMPSIHESFGLVFIESMSHFVPVIGANIPSVSEIINQTGGGLTFTVDNLDDLVKTISKVLDSPSLQQKLGQSGYDYVSKHLTWDKIGDKLCQKISSL